MSGPAAEIARRLSENAEAVCRRYLSNGRRDGHYWMVGDIHNVAGRSLYVRLSHSPEGRGAAGKWTDAASGDHGDLLDIIATSCGHSDFRETLEEAGVRVGKVRYIASQPWPFPSQLMIACIGEALDRTISIDTHELQDARWFTRAEVLQALAGDPDAPFGAPPRYAIAHTLLHAWAEGA